MYKLVLELPRKSSPTHNLVREPFGWALICYWFSSTGLIDDPWAALDHLVELGKSV